MKKLLAIAAFLLASTAAQAQYTFEYGGRTIRMILIAEPFRSRGLRQQRTAIQALAQRSGQSRKQSPQQAKVDPQARRAAPAPHPTMPRPRPDRRRTVTPRHPPRPPPHRHALDAGPRASSPAPQVQRNPAPAAKAAAT